MLDLKPLGELAYQATFATEAEAAEWARAVEQAGWPEVIDVVLAYTSAAVFARPETPDLSQLEPKLKTVRPVVGEANAGRLRVIPVLYDGEDLAHVARECGISVPEVVTAHSAQAYHVFAVGFLPGFPYAGYLPAAISGLARRDSPRVIVPRGAVAIAGRQTGIYPQRSPGGWHLIGRTPLTIVEMDAGYFPIKAGDRIRFTVIGESEYTERLGERL